MPAKDAYKYVLKNAGATIPSRDIVDERIVEEVETGKPYYVEGLDPNSFYQFQHRRLPNDSYKKGIITDISQVGGYLITRYSLCDMMVTECPMHGKKQC